MSVTVAILHGVNVGGRNRVAMSELRTALAEAGLPGARTYVQSGNIVVGGAGPGDIRSTIERVLDTRFAVTTTALCYTGAQWAGIVDANPYPEAAADPTRLAVLFCRNTPNAAQREKLEAARGNGEAFQLVPGAIYLNLPHGQARSKLAAAASALFKTDGTTRNWRTVLALLAMAEAAE